MTEKRYEVYKVTGSFQEWSIEDTLDDKVVFRSIMHKYEADRLCEVLNALHEENEQLRFDFKEFKSLLHSLEEENDELKNLMSVCRNARDVYSKRIVELEEENEQLRREKSKQEEEIEVLKTTIQARDTLIKVCEKKFKELGYIITVDDDGYVIE